MSCRAGATGPAGPAAAGPTFCKAKKIILTLGSLAVAISRVAD